MSHKHCHPCRQPHCSTCNGGRLDHLHTYSDELERLRKENEELKKNEKVAMLTYFQDGLAANAKLQKRLSEAREIIKGLYDSAWSNPPVGIMERAEKWLEEE